MFGDMLLDLLDRNPSGIVLNHVPQDFLRHFQGDSLAGVPSMGREFYQRPLQLSDARLNPLRNESDDLDRQFDFLLFAFLPENRFPSLHIGGLNLGDQPSRGGGRDVA